MKFLTAALFLISLGSNSLGAEDPQLTQLIHNFQTTLHETVSKLQLPENVFLNTSAFLEKYGYPFEPHQVTTEDGFILELHRIPATDGDSPKPAVLMIPPLFCSSIDWVSRGPNVSLALRLYDLGYDIWLLNPRGTRYSMNHEKLNQTQKEFWEFSFHEKGHYDMAASIDYIIKTTGVKKVTTVGFSEGTAASMVLPATRSEYNEKLELVVLLSPIGYMGGVSSPIVLVASHYLVELKTLAEYIHLYGIAYSNWVGELLVGICSIEGFDQICASVMDWFVGFDEDQHDLDWLVVLISDKPSGISLRQLVHFGQEIIDATFRQYDYGSEGNMEHYGTSEPPSYDPANITAPVAVYYAKNDFFASVQDVETLLGKLPNVADSYLVEFNKFSHLDFISAKDVNTLLYDRVLSVIQKYTK
ncbi:lipase 3-like [Euwallacea fornicatus]|uniref:lipase 3-like n=1 Tax=Euwallacea fornicatus TaxID=995702 RepID=UPI003390707F